MQAFMRLILPAIAGTLALSGCAFSWDSEVDGVPLADLDLGGDAPTSIVLAGPDGVVITEGERFTITVDGNKDAGDALRFDRDGDELAIAGSGSIKSDKVSAAAELEIAGSGDVKLASDGNVDVDIAGSGDVIVTGSASCSFSSAGSGSVTCKPAAKAAAKDSGSKASKPEQAGD
jgi:hypothetical protein